MEIGKCEMFVRFRFGRLLLVYFNNGDDKIHKVYCSIEMSAAAVAAMDGHEMRKMYYKIHMKMEKWGTETRPVIIYS